MEGKKDRRMYNKREKGIYAKAFWVYGREVMGKSWTEKEEDKKKEVEWDKERRGWGGGVMKEDRL